MILSFLTRFLPKDSFAKNVGVLVSGTVIAQAITILTMPVVTRLYTPENFGVLSAFVSILTILSIVSAARYELAIPLPEEDKDAINIVFLCIFIVFVFTAFSTIAVYLSADSISNILGEPELEKYLFLLPVSIFLIGHYQIFSRWSIRKKSFNILTKTKITQSIASASIKLLGYKFGALSLIVSQIFSSFVGLSSLIKDAKTTEIIKKCSFNEIKKQAFVHRQLPIYSTWNALFNTASLQFAPILFITIFGSKTAGLFALTLSILSLPSGLIGDAIASVFLSEAPKARRNKTLSKLIYDLHKKLSAIGSIPLIFIILFAPDLFKMVFGDQWRQAGVYAQWMAPWIYMQFQWSPISMLTTVLELQRSAMIGQFLTLLCRFGTLMIAWKLGFSADHAIYAFSIASAVTYSGMLLWFTNKAGLSATKILVTDLKWIGLMFGFFMPFYLFLNYYLK